MARASSSRSIAERSLEVELLLASLGAPPSFALRHRDELHSRKLACDSDGLSGSRDNRSGERPLAALGSVVALISAGRYAAALERASSALAVLPSAEQLAEAVAARAENQPGEAAAGAAAAEAFFCALRGRIGALLVEGGKPHSGSGKMEGEEEERVGKWSAREKALLVLMMGAASLCLFVQANVSGPEPSAVPTLPLNPAPASSDTSATPVDTSALASHPSFLASEVARVALSKWCQVELMTDGADVTGRCHLPQYLLLARTLLLPPLFPLIFPSPSSSSSPSSSTPFVKPSEAFSPSLLPPSWPWWAARVVVIHQRVLQERSPSLRALLLPCTAHLGETLGRKDAVRRALFRKEEEKEEEAEGGEKEGGKEGEGEGEVCVRVAAMVHLEAGMMDMAYAHVDTARKWFERALQECGVVLGVTGAMGYRTIHQVNRGRVGVRERAFEAPQKVGTQVDPKAQLVLIMTRSEAVKEGDGEKLSDTPSSPPAFPHLPLNSSSHSPMVDPKAQLVLAVKRSDALKEGDGAVLSDMELPKDVTCGDRQGQQEEKGEKGEGGKEGDGGEEEEEGESMEELECLFEPEECDVLLAPRLVEGGSGGGEIVANGGEKEEKQSAVDGGTSGVLRGVEQAAVLALAVDTVKQNAADELRGEWDGLSGVGEEGAGGGMRGKGGVLRGDEQAAVLAMAVVTVKQNAADELRGWEAAPYIEAITLQQHIPPMGAVGVQARLTLMSFLSPSLLPPASLLPTSPPSPPPQVKAGCELLRVKAGCELLRVRWERKRPHTRQRAVATMERLIQSVSHQEKRIRQQQSQAASGSSGGAVAAALPEEEAREAAERMKYCFAVWFPTTPALFKEYGEVLVASGCVGEAMRVFETNELWDHLIDCYSLLGKRAAAAALVTARLKEQEEDPRLCLLGKRAAAAALVTARLKEQKEDSRLWCCLGDLTEEKECYEKAWEFSRHRYARAQQALACMAMNAKDFKAAMAHWEAEKERLLFNTLHSSLHLSSPFSIQRALARMAMNSKDFKAAMAHWQAALAISPLHASAWFSLGYSAIQVGVVRCSAGQKEGEQAVQACDGDKALYALTRSVQIDPDNGEAWNNLAVL
ncbi:unnamed protein product [Closterium sp. NIES-64]|nr:unnamed protein product [Closterium sp. NIES-64]